MKDLSIPIYYRIYLQDLTKDYIELVPIGIARTREEASNCCRLFKEALFTASSREVGGRNHRDCTVIFEPVLSGEG